MKQALGLMKHSGIFEELRIAHSNCTELYIKSMYSNFLAVVVLYADSSNTILQGFCILRSVYRYWRGINDILSLFLILDLPNINNFMVPKFVKIWNENSFTSTSASIWFSQFSETFSIKCSWGTRLLWIFSKYWTVSKIYKDLCLIFVFMCL